MLSILLNVSEENAHSSTTVVVIAFVLSAVLFAFLIYIMDKLNTIKEAEKQGGIREYCPRLLDFLMKHYPLAKIVSETPVDIAITAADVYQFVTMKFYLDFNPKNLDVEIKGELIPDKTKWPAVPSKMFVWVLTKNQDAQADESLIINAIKNDMVFQK